MSSIKPAAFAATAKVLFDYSSTFFDNLDEIGLARLVSDLDVGNEVQERVWFPNATPLFDTAFVTQEEWVSLRSLGIGGSEAAVIDGSSRYTTPRELYYRKRGMRPMRQEKAADAVFARGHYLESNVIELFCKQTHAKRLNNTIMWASKQYPYCTANIDAIVELPNGEMAIFEAKTTCQDNFQAWSNDRIPPHYLGQTRQYPAVLADDRITGTYIGCLFTADACIDGVYLGSAYDVNRFVYRWVERNEAAEERQLAAEQKWFDEFVMTKKEPPLTGNPKNEQKVLAQYRTSTQSTSSVQWRYEDYRSLLDDYLAVMEEKKKLESQVKALELKKDKLKLPLIDALGARCEATVPISNEEYIQIRNTPTKGKVNDIERCKLLIDTLPAYGVPQVVIDDLNDCFKIIPDKSRKFSIDVKRKPASKRII